MNGDENLALEDKSNENKEEKPKESQEMAANYKGPTRIYYDLKNRTHTYLPILYINVRVPVRSFYLFRSTRRESLKKPDN